MKRQPIRRKILHLVLSGVLLFSLGAIALLPQPVSAAPDENALEFDGANDYVALGTIGGVSSVYTIEMWVKFGAGVAAGDAIFAGTASKYEPLLYVAYDNEIGILGQGADLALVSNTSLTPGAWYYVAVVFNGNYRAIYINGAFDNDQTLDVSAGWDGAGHLLAARGATPERFFAGVIDEVRISNKARSPAEIADSWNAEAGERFVVDGNTMALWHMDEGFGDTIGDATANDNDGVIYGAGWVEGFLFPSEVGPAGPVVLWHEGSWTDYDTIQEASADAVDDDEIIVFPGTYYGQIVIDKQITVKSRDGAATTIIDAEFGKDIAWEDAAYPAVWIQRDGVEFGDVVVDEFGDVVVDWGFTIKNTPPIVFPEGEEDPSEMGVAILADAPGSIIRGNTIEGSNPTGIFAGGDTTISGNTVEASMLGIFATDFGGGGGGGSIITENKVSGCPGGIYSTFPGSDISGNTISNSQQAIMVGGDDSQIIDNKLYDNQGTAIILQHTSNVTVSWNTITTDTTSVAGIYGIQVEGGQNNHIHDNTISYVLVGGIILNNTSENNLSENDISNIDGYGLSGNDGGNAWWTREQARFEPYSVKMWTGEGEDPLGVARLEIPISSPLEMLGQQLMGEFYFWAYLLDEYGLPRDYWLDHEVLLPTYRLALDNGVILEAGTGCEGLAANEWLKLFAVGDWTHTNTLEEPKPIKPLSEWIKDFSGARVVKISVIYSGAANKTMYIDGSMQEGMPMEPPKGIAIARSDRNSVWGSFILGVNGAGILIVESSQNSIGDGNTISNNGLGVVIENSNENTISGSIIRDNYRGILLRQSYNNQIIGNDIMRNREGMSGIHLDGESDGNEIHANNIVDNTPRDLEGNIIRDEDGNITSFGVVKDGGNWVNATGNWWGDTGGPYHEWHNPGSTGDAVSNEFVNSKPWADTLLPESELPAIVNNLAMPRMTALLGMFRGDVGPEWTSLVVEAYDNPGGVGIAWVTVDLGALLAQMLPEEPEIPPEKQDEWVNWLNQLERSHLHHQGNRVYQRHFNLDEFLHQLTSYLSAGGHGCPAIIIDKLTRGEFSIPVTVADWCGNESYGNIELTIVDIMQPLEEGWNLVSTPVTLEDGYATLDTIFSLGGGPIYTVLEDVMWYDPSLGWGAGPTDEFEPLKALYIYVTGNAQIGFIFNSGVTLPPSLLLDEGWNLVGLAIPLHKWNSMPVNEAMVTVEDVSGLRGYSVVVSPDRRVEYEVDYRYQDAEGGQYHFGGYGWHFHQSPWVYTIGSHNITEMRIGGGYWVFMEDLDTLAGFSTTPIAIWEEEVEEPEPPYGGTLTIFGPGCDADPQSPDIQEGYWDFLMWTQLIHERPFIGDFEKFGPRGTGEFAFQSFAYMPEKFVTGDLVESWEVSPEQIVWHIRPGVFWAADNVDWMETRELTAEDVVADLLYFREAPGGQSFKGWSGDIYATDRYTAVIEFTQFDAGWFYIIGYEDRSVISPPEMVQAGHSKWENQVGTGPFMFKEYVVGSYMVYERNPNWRKTTILNGVEYQLPFVDKVVRPIIPDVDVQMAALRTGTLDYFHWPPFEHWEMLDETCPELLKIKMPSPGVRLIGLRCDKQPFDDIRVRRALMIGTNREAIANALFIEAEMHNWPINPQLTSVYTPFDQLPESTRWLFEYNPERAKALLAEAGYPDGFQLSFLLSAADPLGIDMASMISDMWAEIGVMAEFYVVEAGAYFELINAREGYDVMTITHLNTNPLLTLRNAFLPGARGNFANYDNPYFTERCQQAVQTVGSTERNAILKELAVIGLDDVPYIPFPTTPTGVFWWPWVKNFYGETNIGDHAGFQVLLAYDWLDLDLKAEMGY